MFDFDGDIDALDDMFGFMLVHGMARQAVAEARRSQASRPIKRATVSGSSAAFYAPTTQGHRGARVSRAESGRGEPAARPVARKHSW